MKNTIRTTIIAALLVGLTAAPAHADDEALAAFGGFVVGMITGAVIENNHDHHYDGGIEISYERHGDYGRHQRYYRGPRGHWEIQRYRVWIPGHWNLVVNHCGDRVRVWKSGRYTYKSKKVWVAKHSRGRHHSYRD